MKYDGRNNLLFINSCAVAYLIRGSWRSRWVVPMTFRNDLSERLEEKKPFARLSFNR
jgi:hypothetical protein